MNYKAIVTILTLLGFGSACSTTKAPKSKEVVGEEGRATKQKVDTLRELEPIRLMYGAPRRVYRVLELEDEGQPSTNTEQVDTPTDMEQANNPSTNTEK